MAIVVLRFRLRENGHRVGQEKYEVAKVAGHELLAQCLRIKRAHKIALDGVTKVADCLQTAGDQSGEYIRGAASVKKPSR
jgi:hypothetical protein